MFQLFLQQPQEFEGINFNFSRKKGLKEEKEKKRNHSEVFGIIFILFSEEVRNGKENYE